jgi:hypothetical protein
MAEKAQASNLVSVAVESLVALDNVMTSKLVLCSLRLFHLSQNLNCRFFRFLSIDTEAVDAITLEDAKNAVMQQLIPSDFEITIAGDFVVNDVLDMIRNESN